MTSKFEHKMIHISARGPKKAEVPVRHIDSHYETKAESNSVTSQSSYHNKGSVKEITTEFLSQPTFKHSKEVIDSSVPVPKIPSYFRNKQRILSNNKPTLELISPKTQLIQTQSISRCDLNEPPPMASVVDADVERSTVRNVHLKSKIARLTTIYSNPSLKKPPVYKKETREGLPSDFRLLGDSLCSTTQSKAPTIQKFKGVIPPSLRLGKTFIQQQQVMTPQSAMSSIGGFSFFSAGKAVKDASQKLEEDEGVARVNSKIRRVAESCSRSTAANSTVKQQDSIKGLSSFSAEKIEKMTKGRSKRCNDKRLVEVIERVKEVIDEYKKREGLLVKQNKALKEEVAALRKALDSNQTK